MASKLTLFVLNDNAYAEDLSNTALHLHTRKSEDTFVRFAGIVCRAAASHRRQHEEGFTAQELSKVIFELYEYYAAYAQ